MSQGPVDDADDTGNAATLVSGPVRESAPTLPIGSAQLATQGTTPPPGTPKLRAGRDSLGAPPPLPTDDRYAFAGQLGQGGMGEVLLARDGQIGREVAIKRMRAAAPSHEETRRFLREAKIQGRLQHPAVVPVHDIAVDRDGRPFFVMKRLSGVTMQSLLAKPPVELAAERPRLLRAFVDVCLATEFAHRQGIVHRDLKPANIMLGELGEVYVLDWGVARAVDADDELASADSAPMRPSHDEIQTQAGMMVGTPGYMAPEQVQGDKIGPAADIYALGCVLFEIVTGQSLLPRGNAALVATVVGVDARCSQVSPDAPPELDAICVRATATEPGDRYQSASELADAVQGFLDGDRDVALRRTLAVGHVTRAREALAAGDGERERRVAMQEAGRALALDPTANDAAQLVSHLMLTPPKVAPPEVLAQLEAIDVEAAKVQGRLAAIAMGSYAVFVPLVIWAGVRSWAVVIAAVVTVILSAGHIWTMTLGDRIPATKIYVSALLNATLVVLVGRITGPFLITPALAATMVIGYCAHPRFGRAWIVTLLMIAAVLVPWCLEAGGVLKPTYAFMHGHLTLTSNVIELDALPMQLMLGLVLIAMLAVVAVLTRTMALRQREARLQLELQSWQLRQLVPMESGTPSAAITVPGHRPGKTRRGGTSE